MPVLFVLFFQFGRDLFGLTFLFGLFYLSNSLSQTLPQLRTRQVYLGSSGTSPVLSVDVLMVPRDVTASTSGSSQAFHGGRRRRYPWNILQLVGILRMSL